MKILGIFLCALSMLTVLMASPAAAYRIDVYDNGSSIVNFGDAESLVESGAIIASDDMSIIEFDDLGDGTRGNYSVNNAFPGIALTGNSDFAVTVTGSIYLTAGDWTFGLNHDDGARLTVGGSTIAADGIADNRNSLLYVNGLTAGYYDVEILFFEHLGGASLEFFGAPGSYSAWNSNDFSLIESAPVPEPTTLLLFGTGLAGIAGLRKKYLKR